MTGSGKRCLNIRTLPFTVCNSNLSEFGILPHTHTPLPHPTLTFTHTPLPTPSHTHTPSLCFKNDCGLRMSDSQLKSYLLVIVFYQYRWLVGYHWRVSKMPILVKGVRVELQLRHKGSTEGNAIWREELHWWWFLPLLGRKQSHELMGECKTPATEIAEIRVRHPGIRTQTSWKKLSVSNLIVLWGSEPICRPWMSAAKRGCFSKRSKPYM